VVRRTRGRHRATAVRAGCAQDEETGQLQAQQTGNLACDFEAELKAGDGEQQPAREAAERCCPRSADL
jgi:hypothetical protein